MLAAASSAPVRRCRYGGCGRWGRSRPRETDLGPWVSWASWVSCAADRPLHACVALRRRDDEPRRALVQAERAARRLRRLDDTVPADCRPSARRRERQRMGAQMRPAAEAAAQDRCS